MRSKLYFIGVPLLTSCLNFFPADNRVLPLTTVATVTQQAVYVSNTPTELFFDVSMSWVFNDQFALYIDSTSIHFSGTGTYSLVDPKNPFEITSAGASGSSSTVFLIDQSGSYDSTDQFNSRSKGINKFLSDTKDP